MPKGKRSNNIKSTSSYGDLQYVWEDNVKRLGLNKGEMTKIRLVGPIFVMGRHWIPTIKNKSFGQWCTKFNSDSERKEEKWECPACDDFNLRITPYIVGNCILRKAQEHQEANPIRVFIFPMSVKEGIAEVASIINAPVEDPEKGCDLAIKYDPKSKSNTNYSVRRVTDTALTEEEKNYTLYDLANILPEFSEEKTRRNWGGQVKDVLYTNNYYVIQTKDYITPEDPWASFVRDMNGKRWSEFPELVAFEQSKEDKRNRKGGTPYSKVKVDKTRRKKEKRFSGADSIDDEFDKIGLSNKPKKKKKKKKIKPPKCFKNYDGSEKCKKCNPKIRKICQQRTKNI